jgi:hypothetical protein
MKREYQKHKLAYAVLFAGLTLFVAAFLGFWPNHGLQRAATLAVMLFYFVWGCISHVKTESLSRKVVLEYAGVSLLGGVALLILTF